MRLQDVDNMLAKAEEELGYASKNGNENAAAEAARHVATSRAMLRAFSYEISSVLAGIQQTANELSETARR